MGGYIHDNGLSGDMDQLGIIGTRPLALGYRR